MNKTMGKIALGAALGAGAALAKRTLDAFRAGQDLQKARSVEKRNAALIAQLRAGSQGPETLAEIARLERDTDTAWALVEAKHPGSVPSGVADRRARLRDVQQAKQLPSA